MSDNVIQFIPRPNPERPMTEREMAIFRNQVMKAALGDVMAELLADRDDKEPA